MLSNSSCRIWKSAAKVETLRWKGGRTLLFGFWFRTYPTPHFLPSAPSLFLSTQPTLSAFTLQGHTLLLEAHSLAFPAPCSPGIKSESIQVGETNGEWRPLRLENSCISNKEVGLRIRAVPIAECWVFSFQTPNHYIIHGFHVLKESLLLRKAPEVCTNIHTTCRRGQGPAEVGGTHSMDECLAVGIPRVLLHTFKPCVPTGDTENAQQAPCHLHGAGALIAVAGGGVQP